MNHSRTLRARRRHGGRLAAGAVALGLVAAACGSDGSDTASTEAPVETSVTTMDMTTTPPVTDPPATDPPATDPPVTDAPDATDADATASDIVDTAIAAGDFTTLVAAVQAAGLEETLRGPGPFTVFAPTDDAFAALPAGTVDTLLADPTGDLADILTYHVVPGVVLSSDVAGLDGQAVETVNGATFTVNVGDDGSVSLIDGAGNEVGVIAVDVEAGNGVIHVLDGVLLPG